MYKKILVPLDGSELAEQVLPHVAAIVQGGTVNEVLFLRVIETPPVSSGGDYFISNDEEAAILSRRKNNANLYLEELIDRNRSLNAKLSGEVILGKADEQIVDTAAEHGIDLIVMATHGRSGVSRWLMGSVADRIVRWSCIPVLVVRPKECIPKT